MFVATPAAAGSHAKPPRKERPGVFHGDPLRGGKKSISHDAAGGEPVKHGQVRLSESSAGDEEESGGRKYHPKSSPTSQLLQVCSSATPLFLLLFILVTLPRALFFLLPKSGFFFGHSLKNSGY